MKFEDFMKKIGDLPVIDTESLLAGITDSKPFKVQISRWQKGGKLIQIKRGIYLLNAPYRQIEPSGFYVASVLKRPSYISLEKALEYYNLIPEAITIFTSVTTKRPGKFISKAGTFEYQHIQKKFFWGYQSILLKQQTAFIAFPEKALLDFFYFRGVKIDGDYLAEMRLQNVQDINFPRLMEYARKFQKPGMLRVAKIIQDYALAYQKKEKIL